MKKVGKQKLARPSLDGSESGKFIRPEQRPACSAQSGREGGRQSQEAQENASLKEGLDYYLEDGKYVFTVHYLKKRGYCCRSGCRHCPYGYDQSGSCEGDC